MLSDLGSRQQVGYYLNLINKIEKLYNVNVISFYL